MHTELFRQPGYKAPPAKLRFLNDDVYAAAICGMVIVCTDVAIINRNRRLIYLAKRRIKPWPHPWIMGGRCQAGETPHESMRRNFCRETGLALPQDRFTLIGLNRYQWVDRAQEPQDIGSDNLAYTFTVELGEEDIDCLELDENEYVDGSLQAYNWNQLQAPNIHPVLRLIYQQAFGPIRPAPRPGPLRRLLNKLVRK